MDFKRFLRAAAACFLALSLLAPTAAASSAAGSVPPADSANVVAAALGEVGYTEGEKEYSKFGQWYGLPNSYWCDMFVSWCAMKAGVPEEQFPRDCSCTSHVKKFSQLERYRYSAARGGTYTPLQGDVIFFYNNIQYPDGKVCSHTGLVLYVEDGYIYTIEGNALANRLDLDHEAATELRDGSLEPPDYVVINRYPLNDPHIHGYGIPAYDLRTPLALDGFVDLGRHKESASAFQYMCDTGLMSPTSTHTFSPNHGMTRGDFLVLVTEFFGIPAGSAFPFDDVAPDSACYSAVMAARAAGLINGAEKNCFQPDLYISASDAQMILTRALERFQLPVQYAFSQGDYSYLLSPYTIRADIATVFYSISQMLPQAGAYDGQVYFGTTQCPARSLYGVCYVPADVIKENLPGLEVTAGQVAFWNTDRVIPLQASLSYEGAEYAAGGFVCQGVLYIDLCVAADLLHLDLACSTQPPQDAPDSSVTIVRFDSP